MPIKNVAAIIVNWHRWSLTLQSIHSLQQAHDSLPDVDLRIVVVDNETEGFPQEVPSTVDVIREEDNLGYGAGNNVGVAHALACAPQPDALLILNNDATIDANSLGSLIQALVDQPHVAVAAPVLRSPMGDIESAGGHFGPQREWWTSTSPDFPIDFVSGAAFLIRREAWLEVGGFDVRYFHYVEDLDLGWQLRKAGWKLIVVPESTVSHLKSQSSSSNDSFLAYYTIRNQLLFLHKERTSYILGRNTWTRILRNLFPVRHMMHGDFHTLPWVWRGLWDGVRGKGGRVR